jgi:hypothetical protein
MGWHELEGRNAKEEKQNHHEKQEESIRALRTAARGAVSSDKQRPLKDFLLTKAHVVSYSPNVSPADVAFYEGQRSMALQILKLAGEI